MVSPPIFMDFKFCPHPIELEARSRVHTLLGPINHRLSHGPGPCPSDIGFF